MLIRSAREEPDLFEERVGEEERVERTSSMRLGRTTDETNSAISLEVIFHTTSLLFRVGDSLSSTSSWERGAGMGVEKKREGRDGVNGEEEEGGWTEGSV